MSRPDGYLVPEELDVDAVVAEVARGFRVTTGEILGRGRARHVHAARVCAMAVIREWTGLSFPAIGRIFNRDHTTVMHAVRKVMGDPDLSRSVRLVVEELLPAPRLFVVADVDHQEAV